jgi:transcriptional regulator with XRE-family HTH domain
VASIERARETRLEICALATFAHSFKALRARLYIKQVTLSREIRCTEAAISYWESGRRLPQQESLLRILGAFDQYGATPSELKELEQAWQMAAIRRATGTASHQT